MAELAYPYHRLNAQGPAETGFSITLKVEAWPGGPLAGQSEASVLAGLRALLLAGDGDVSTELTKFEITSTYS